MKSIIVGITLFSFPFIASSQINLTSEVLIGNTKNEVHSRIKSEVSEGNYSTSLHSDSIGFRLALNFTPHFTIELSKHEHGEVDNNFTLSMPTMSPSEPIFLPPEFDTIYEANIPIELESIKFGLKGQFEVYSDTSINARLGLVHWKYGEFTPQQLSHVGTPANSGESGNDIYYSIGAEYQFTKNIYVGIEYSQFTINESYGGKNPVSASFNHDIKDFSLILGWAF